MPMLGDYDLERLLDSIRWQESRDNQMAVSPKGARTAYGIMPTTAADPGYGMQGQDIGMLVNDENAARDFARQYFTKMYDRTQDVPSALAAYNGGLGRGLSFKRGGSVPRETAGYVPAVLGHYKSGTGAQPVATASTGRMRWDTLMQKFNPISSAQAAEASPMGPGMFPPQEPSNALLYHPTWRADEIGPKDQSRFENEEAPAELGGVNSFGPNDPAFASVPEPVGPPKNIMPTSDNPAVGGVASTGTDPYLDKLQQLRTPRSDNKYAWLGDAGMAIGAGLMQAAGVPVQGGALLASSASRRKDRLEDRKLDVEQNILEETYRSLVQSGIDQGLAKPEASRRAFILASNPKLADELGIGNKETFGVNPETFTLEDGTRGILQYGSKGTMKAQTLDGKAVSPEQMKGARLTPGIKVIETETEQIVLDRDTGVELSRKPLNKEEGARQTKAGTITAEAQAELGTAMDTGNQALSVINKALDHPGRKQFTGWSQYNPFNAAPGSDYQNYKGIYDQIKGGAFLSGFQAIKGAGPISDAEGKAATAAQTAFTQSQSDEAAEQSLREMQYLYLQRQARAYLRAKQGIPDELKSQLNIARQYIYSPEVKAVDAELGQSSYGNANPVGAPVGPTIRRTR